MEKEEEIIFKGDGYDEILYLSDPGFYIHLNRNQEFATLMRTAWFEEIEHLDHTKSNGEIIGAAEAVYIMKNLQVTHVNEN